VLAPRAISPFHTSLAWSPDGTKLAATEIRSEMIDILDAITGQIIVSAQGPARDLENGIASIAWSPDGMTLIADEYNGNVQSWNAETGELIETLPLNREGGRFLMSLSPYGGRLALGNSAPVSETASTQATRSDVQILANGAIQIVVPAPSLERLQAIAEACNAPAPIEQSLTASIQANQLTNFVPQVEALPENTIPPAGAADLIAVAEALQSR